MAVSYSSYACQLEVPTKSTINARLPDSLEAIIIYKVVYEELGTPIKHILSSPGVVTCLPKLRDQLACATNAVNRYDCCLLCPIVPDVL
jgi:hypothetical protein